MGRAGFEVLEKGSHDKDQAPIGYRRFGDIVREIALDRRARMMPSRPERAPMARRLHLRNCGEHPNLTQQDLAERFARAQFSISAMEAASDNLLSTVRDVVEGMGGHLELAAVVGDERVSIQT